MVGRSIARIREEIRKEVLVMKWEYIVAAFLIGMAVCQSNWYIAHFLLIVGLGLALYRVMVVEPPYWEEEGDVDSK